MKTLYTIYTNFAKRLALVLTLLLTLGVTSAWGANVTFQRITSTSELTSGAKYLIVYESGKLIFNGSSVATGATGETTTVTISNNTITCDEAYAFTITSSSSSWKITGSNGKSIGHTGSSNSLTTGNYTNTITFSNNNVVIGCNSRTLRCNPNNGSPLFRYYTSEQQAIQLYKQTVSTFTVKCQSNNANYGTVSQSSVTNVANNTSISSNGNKLTVGSTTITATPKEQDANYTYAFSNWSGIPVGGKVTADVTVTAYFTSTARALTNYRTTCSTETVVTLHPNGGSGETTTETIEGTTYTVPACSFSRLGYTFANWNTKKDGTGISYNTGATINNLDGTDVNLYAQWTCETPVFDIKIKNDNPVVFSGESIELTVVGSNIAADATYQWYKYNGATYDELAGKTTNELTIAEATVNDAGNYKCKVTNGTCSAENNYTVKMYSLRGLTDNNWSTDFVFTKVNATTATYSMELAGNSSYDFKVYDGGVYYGNTGGNPTMTSDNCTNWTMQENMGNNVTLQTTAAGTYTFTLDYTDASNPTISVTYPAKRIVYLNPDVWAIDNPKFAVHAWHGSTAEDILMTKIDDCNNRNIYFAEIDAAHTHVIFIRGDKDSYDISNPWNNVWNQTGDLTIDNVQYNIGSEWDFSKASWTAFTPNYTVTFDANGHGTAPADQCIAEGGKVTTPTAPTATGYTFGGWYKEAGCTNAWDFAADVVTADITLYAKWTINTHTVTWKPAGGNWGGDSDDIVEEYAYGEEIKVPEEPAYDCHEFVAWDPVYTVGMTMPDDDLEFTAQWNKLSYTITFKNYDGTVLQTSTVECGETPSYAGAEPTREQTAQYTYTFKGWSPTIAPATQDQVYTAQFTQTTRQYTVTWMVGTTEYTAGAPTNQVEYDKKVTNLPTSPQDDAIGTCANKFMGWSTQSSGSTPKEADYYDDLFTTAAESPEITKPTTFYAVFATGEETTGGTVEASLSFASTAQRTSWSESQQVWTQNGVTLTNNRGDGSEIADNSNPARFYKNSEIIVEHTSGKITKIVFDCNTDAYATALKNSIGSISGTVSSSGDKVTVAFTNAVTSFTVTLSSGQVRMDALTVTAGGGTITTYSNYVTNCCATPVPTNGSYTSPSGTSVTLTWDGESTQYHITGEGLDDYTDDESYTITDLEECEEYVYYVSAYPEGGCESEAIAITAQPFSGAKTVTFNYNGNGQANTTSSTSCGNTSITLPTPTWAAYRFMGWFNAASGGIKIGEAGASYKPTDDITLYAQWEKEYTVTYNANGGSTSCANGNYIAGETVTVCTTNPSKTGHTFTGWTYSPNVTITDGKFVMPASDVTITAQWQVNSYTVTWNPDGGNWGGSTANIVATYEYGATIVQPAAPQRDGYRFTGWSPAVSSPMPAGNKTYTAQWKQNYTITFYDGNDVTPWTQTKDAESIDLNNYVGTHACGEYNFAGWSTDATPYNDQTANITTWVTGTYTPAASIDLYAVYVKGDLATDFTLNCAGGVYEIWVNNSAKNHMAGRLSSYNLYTTEYWDSNKTGSNGAPFTITRIAENTYTIQNADGEYITCTSTNSDDLGVETAVGITDRYKWIISTGTNGTWRFTNKASSEYALVFYERYFQLRKATNVTLGSDYYDLELTPAASNVYQSNPNCGPYYIRFETHGGEFIQGEEYPYGEEKTGLTETTYSIFPAAELEGYTFAGWKDGSPIDDEITADNAVDGPYLKQAGEDLIVSSNKTYHAVYYYYDEEEDIDFSKEFTTSIYAEVNGMKYFLAGTPSSGTMSSTTDCGYVSEVTITPGTGENAGKYKITVNGVAMAPKQNETDLLNGTYWWTITERSVGSGEYKISGQDKKNIGLRNSSWGHYAYNQGSDYGANYYYPHFGKCLQHHWTSFPTDIYTITWKVGDDTHATTTVQAGKTISSLPTNPANDALGCCADAFVGWSTKTNPTKAEVFNDVANAPAITGNQTFHAVFATAAPGAGTSLLTFSEMGYANAALLNQEIVLGDGEGNGDATVTFAQSVGGTAPAYYNDGAAARAYAGNTITVAATYANTVLTQIDFAFAKGENANAITASPGTITDGVWKGNAQSVIFTIGGDKGHRRIASIAVTTEVTGDKYTNYVTKCDLSNSASIGTATLTYANGTAIDVKCGQRSPASKAATLTFASAQDLTCPVTIEATTGFLVSTNKNDNSKYASSITVKPVKTGANKGKLPTIYVRAEANFGVSGQMNGTITASGDEITTTQVNVLANVTCTQYTLTVVDHLGNTISTAEYYEGDEVAEVDDPATDDCSKDYTFDGWSETSVEYGSLIYNKVSFPYSMPANDVTLYPVYQVNKQSDYHRVTEDLGANNWEGQYMIAFADNIFANGTTGGTDGIGKSGVYVNPQTALSDDKQTITQNYGDEYHVTLEKYNEGYVLKTRDDKYNYYTNHNNDNKISASETKSTAGAYAINVVFESQNDIKLCLSGAAEGSIFGYRNAFRYFITERGPVYLYKRSPLYTTPLICGTIEAENAVVTSTAGQTIKVNVPITITSSLGGTTNITAESDNNHFAVTPLENVTVGDHMIAVHYTPDATTDGTETANITLTASHGNRATTTFQVTGRHLPENFVIAAKWGDNWYALPANMTSESITEGVLIEVDDAAAPTKALAAPNTTKYGLKSVYTSNGSADRYANNGERLVFVENVEEATPVANKTLYNGGGDAQNSNKTSIQVYAQYTNYHTGAENQNRYEWIPTTTDLMDYTLTSAHAFASEAARTISLDKHGIFGTLLQDKSYSGMVRLLPVDNFYAPVELQVVEWKEDGVNIMYTGNGTKATTQIGNGTVSSVLLSDAKMDHAVYNLTTSISLTEATNQPLIISIKDDVDATIGAIKLTIPAIFYGNKTSTELVASEESAKATDIVILDGATLTAGTTKYTYDNITVYPGGSLIIGKEGKLGMNSLTMRAGSSWGADKYENKYPHFLLAGEYSNTSGQINLDYVTTVDYYYPLSVPEEVTIAEIKYPTDIYGNNVDKANTGSFQLKYYDGAQRVEQGSQYGTGWVVVDESTTTTLAPNKGYAIWGIPKKINGTRQTYGIHRIPIKKAAGDLATNEKTNAEVQITAHGINDANVLPNDKGWNYLGNPYLAGLGGMDGTDGDLQMGLLVQEVVNGQWTGGWVNNGEQVRYITLTNDCQTFEAKPVAEAQIPAFTTFFIQAAQDGAIALTAPTNAVPSSIAARQYAAQQEAAKEITTGILLTGNDQTDRTGLLIADNFTEEYEFNADLSKFENSGINLYTIGKTGKLAYMAINQTLAEQPIPVGYSAPAEGLYTIAFDEDRYNATDISALYLIDYDSNEKTNLLHTDYSFVTAAGTNNQRFALQVAFAPENATNVEWVGDATVQVGVEGNTLMLNNLPTDAAVHVFDALGRLMYHAPTVPTEMQLTLPTGYYLVRIADKQNAVVIKTVIP